MRNYIVSGHAVGSQEGNGHSHPRGEHRPFTDHNHGTSGYGWIPTERQRRPYTLLSTSPQQARSDSDGNLAGMADGLSTLVGNSGRPLTTTQNVEKAYYMCDWHE